MPQDYPLFTLLDARKKAKESAELLCDQHAGALEDAEKLERERRTRLELARRRLAAHGQEQLEQAQHRFVTVSEVQTAEYHRQSLQSEVQRIARELELAIRTTLDRRAALLRAQEKAVLARQELAVVERHFAQFTENLARAEELRSEENAADIWAAKWQLPKGRAW